MKFVGMVIGGLLSAIGHMIAFIFKNIYIAIRRFAMDPANKNIIWNFQSVFLLIVLLMSLIWLVGKYQDQYYGASKPIFYRAIPLLIPCFLGQMIYSSPVFFKNSYAKPIIQTFLNALSIIALGQILLNFVSYGWGLAITIVLFIATVFFTLYYSLLFNVKNTIFSKLSKTVEQTEMNKNNKNENPGIMDRFKKKESITEGDFSKLEGIDLSKPGCLAHLRYYSEECILELFHTLPTKDKQSQLMFLNRRDRAQHSQTVGGTGAGKTVLATNLLTQDLLNDYMGSTVLEPKGPLIDRLSNFMDRTGRSYFRLDPQIEDTDCLNPFYVPEGEDIEPMIEANVSAFHGYLGPDAVQYFKSRSTQLMRVGIKALKMVFGNECGYNELDRLIQPLNDDFRAEVLSELKGQENQVPLLLEYTRNMAGGQKMQEHAMQTYSNLYDYLTELTSNKYIQKIFCGKSTFNIDDALKNGQVILVNGAYGALQTLTYTVGRLYLNLLRASTFRRNLKEKIRPHQLTVDEVEMFADEEFSTFMEMAREFEVFVSVIHQGNEQLTDVSRRLGAMVKQNAVQKFILAGLENEDAEYYAKMIGEEYKIGTSSSTDEMAATGFKTQIKEEKRYTVMPSQILKLKGIDPEHGEPGECLFRGVQNNIRLEPVIGLIYPLPRALFAELKQQSTVDLNSKQEQDSVTSGEEVGLSDINLWNKSMQEQRLEKLKEKAQLKTPTDANMENSEKRDAVLTSDSSQNTNTRNSMWDSESEAVAAQDEVLNREHDKKVKFVPASIDDTTLRIAEKIKRSTEGIRSNKKNSEAE